MSMNLNGAVYDGGSVTVSIVPSPSGLPGGDANPLNTVASTARGVGGKLSGILGFKNVQGIEAISYGVTVDRVAVKGSGQIWDKGFTPGMLRYSNGSMTLWQSTLQQLVDDQGGIEAFCLYTSFDVIITYRTQLSLPLAKVELKGCRPIGVNNTHTLSSAENITADLEFQVGKILYNGNDIIQSALKGLSIGNAIANF